MNIRRIIRRPLLAAAAIVATLAPALATMPPAQAQPVLPPPGWVGPHYYYHGQHWHHRAWARDRYHHRYYRYY